MGGWEGTASIIISPGTEGRWRAGGGRDRKQTVKLKWRQNTKKKNVEDVIELSCLGCGLFPDEQDCTRTTPS